MESLKDYNARKSEEHQRKYKLFTGIACPNCGGELRDKDKSVMLSSPAKKNVFCENTSCNFTGMRYV